MAGCSERYLVGIIVGACILHVVASTKSQALLFYKIVIDSTSGDYNLHRFPQRYVNQWVSLHSMSYSTVLGPSYVTIRQTSVPSHRSIP